ncbi:hypothetical protein [Streptomyces fragilis]|uniref:Integral membrane protein n=1 Tax=Streptomyces fragilis TaxID=67301 RepID=A0ABV2YBL6_9ACTN|nr:hypothetical protein [Streptomyces fragilis]
MDMSRAPLRAARAVLFTALAVTVGSASHVLLSGAPLPLSTVAAVCAAVFVAAWALAGRERRFGSIAALLVPLELAVDTVFTSGQHACYGAAGGPVTGPLHSVGLDLLCAGTPVGTSLTPAASPEGAAAVLAESGPGAAWALLACHVGVGLLAAAWLSRGERALAQVLRAVAATTFRPLLVAFATVAAPAVRVPRPAVRATAAAAPRIRYLVRSLGLRGPPAPHAAVAAA